MPLLLRGSRVVLSRAQLWERKASCRCHIHQCDTSICVKRLRVHTSVCARSSKALCNERAFEHTVLQNDDYYSSWAKHAMCDFSWALAFSLLSQRVSASSTSAVVSAFPCLRCRQTIFESHFFPVFTQRITTFSAPGSKRKILLHLLFAHCS